MAKDEIQLREFIEIQFTAVRGEIKASSDMSHMAMKSLKEQIIFSNLLQSKINDKVIADIEELRLKQASCDVKNIEKDVEKLKGDTEGVGFLMSNPKIINRAFLGSMILALISFISFITLFLKFSKHL